MRIPCGTSGPNFHDNVTPACEGGRIPCLVLGEALEAARGATMADSLPRLTSVCAAPLRGRRPARHQSGTCAESARYSGGLDAAGAPADIDVAGFKLRPLKGELKGFWAITVGANWRVVFRFADGDALDVDYVDYH